MSIKKRIIFLFFILSFQFILVNSSEILSLKNSDYFNYLNFLEENNSNTNKISYEILYDKNIEGDLYFNLETIFNGKRKGNICTYKININKNSIFNKIICEVPKFGTGKYLFKATLMKNNSVINALENNYEIKPIIILDKKTNSTISFVYINNNKTKIILNILNTSKNLIVYNKIPKKVINNLNENNKNSLISSNLNYKIIEEDPLIAWNIKKAPTKIEYTINKKIDKKDMQNFSLEIKKNKTFQIFQYITFLLILLIVFLIFNKSLFKNNKKWIQILKVNLKFQFLF